MPQKLSKSAPAKSSGGLSLMASPQKKQKNEVSTKPKDDVELALERAVFGDLEGFEEGLKEAAEPEYFEEPDDSAESEFSEDEEQEVATTIENLHDDELFVVDGVNDQAISAIVSGDVSMTTAAAGDHKKERGPPAAWVDSDDERLNISLASTDRLRKLRSTEDEDYVNGMEYTARLRSQFQRLYPVPDWANTSIQKRKKQSANSSQSESSDDDYEAEDDEERLLAADPLKALLQSTARYTSTSKSKLLPASILDISRLRDANQQAPSQAAIQTLSFHPTLPLLLSAGYDRTLRIYNADGKVNPLATSLHIRSSPVQTAQFHPDGRRAFAGGRRRYFYIWDLESGSVDRISRMYGHERHQHSMERFKLSPCGRFIGLIGSGGWINLLDASSGQWISGAKIEGGQVADFEWSQDGGSMTIANSAGEVWEWSTSERRYISRWADYGGIGITTISATDRWVALGSQSGIVNVYDKTKKEDDGPKLFCTFDNLVTSISGLKFTHDGQLLGIASRAKKDAFRFAHLPSGTVFKNWPTSGTPLGKVTAMAFSGGSEMFVTGNEGGKVRLFKLNHYA
ncbi:WD40-repeat-containing domain protein [Lipomyces orientalis]|uniref:WD40-repeat-containing domain protein n=1 Tax=Lipomyces orientalis TaxID=1233043 RepID=A0ACC3TZG0_9ASCO